LKAYSRAELRTSDHRPVYAIFQVTVREVDEIKKEQIAKSIIHEIRKSGSRDGNIDERVERGLNGGISGLVKEMTHSEHLETTLADISFDHSVTHASITDSCITSPASPHPTSFR
jgi:hypothetical protein